MASEPAVRCTNLGKRYQRRWGPSASRADLWALRGVTLDVASGASFGVLGRNGAGKSTLLRLLGGVGVADEGEVHVRGRVGALLELGGEFSPELSGRRNAQLAGMVAGLRRRAIDGLLDDVFGFAELEQEIDAPLRTYSSGMRARLAFSVAAHLAPDVLLIDEVLAVGDLAFRARCVERIHRFRIDGVTIVLVSHEPALIRELCDVAIWLDAGRLVASGPTAEVLDQYVREMGARTTAQTADDLAPTTTAHGVALRARENRFGTQRASIRDVEIVAPDGQPCTAVSSGSPVGIRVVIDADPELGAVHLAVVLRRRDGLACVEAGTLIPPDSRSHESLVCSLAIARLDVAPGTYSFEVGIWSADWRVTYDLQLGAYELIVVGDTHPDAVLAPPLTWSLRPPSSGHSP